MTYPHDTYDPNAIQEDLTQVDEAADFSPAPAASYLCRLIDVNTDGKTDAGDRRWGLRWEAVAVITPDNKLVTKDEAKRWAGKSVWDNLVFSQKAASRRKLIYSRIGIDTSRPFSPTPDLLLGRWAIVTWEVEERFSKKLEKNVLANTVPFRGYESVSPQIVQQLEAAGKAPKLVRDREDKSSGGGGESFDYGANA